MGYILHFDHAIAYFLHSCTLLNEFTLVWSLQKELPVLLLIFYAQSHQSKRL